jgi:N-acetylglucosaminyldiphosphoundecaprenol N-acetyl-beta-D-mannosaminyltransferase
MNFSVLLKQDLFIPPTSNIYLKLIIPANAIVIWFANNNKRFMNICNNNYVSFDGTVPYWVAKEKYKHENFVKLSGSDIIYDFCNYAYVTGLRVFLLGGDNVSNRKAIMNLKKLYRINVAGFSPPNESYPFSGTFNKECIRQINRFRPDILFIGFGVPKQEYFVDDNYNYLKNLGIKYVICCGGAIDFISGKRKRAPKIIQELGLEGLYRFFKEPSLMRIKRIMNSFRFIRYIYHPPDF